MFFDATVNYTFKNFTYQFHLPCTCLVLVHRNMIFEYGLEPHDLAEFHSLLLVILWYTSCGIFCMWSYHLQTLHWIGLPPIHCGIEVVMMYILVLVLILNVTFKNTSWKCGRCCSLQVKKLPFYWVWKGFCLVCFQIIIAEFYGMLYLNVLLSRSSSPLFF